MRKKIVAGNWKMNLDKISSKNLVLEILEKTENNDKNIIISPPFIYLEDTVKEYQSKRQGYYESLSTFSTFGKGWTRRVEETTKLALDII